MRPGVRTAIARTFRFVARPPAPEDLVEVEGGVLVPRFELMYGDLAVAEAATWFERFPRWLDVTGKDVLDVGCGPGELCLEAARRGARRVVGVEVEPERIKLGNINAQKAGGDLPVDLRLYGGDLEELGSERFDLVLSKDSFEHYGALPGTPSAEQMVTAMGRRLHVGGLLLIGFGPLWKAPYGGHIDVKLPWAHLVFPESVIFDEFRRVRPSGKTAQTFEEGVGVNRMTLGRFRRLMEGSGLELLHLAYNVTQNRMARPMNGLRRLPGAEEYFTQNAYGVWRRPSDWAPSD